MTPLPELTMHDELPDMLHATAPAVSEMPPVVRLAASSLAVSASVAVVYLAPLLIPYTGETVATGLGIALGGFSSILVVASAVVMCRGLKRLGQRKRMRADIDSARSDPGPLPPVVG